MAKMVSPYWKVDLISVAQVYSSCCSNLNEKIGHEIETPFKFLLWITAFQLSSFEVLPMLATCPGIVFAKRNDLTLSFLTVLFNLINVWSQTSSVIFVRPVTIILWISVEEFKFWVQKIFKIFFSFSIRFLGWQWCWWHRNVGDFTMVADFRCWWQNHYVGDFFRCVGDFLDVLNRSPSSWIGHQHLKLVTNTFGLQHLSPTSM